MLCHDSRLERTTTGRGRVSAQTLAAIRGCDAGGWFAPEFTGEAVPSLDEALLLAVKLGLAANIEIKADRGRAADGGPVAGLNRAIVAEESRSGTQPRIRRA